MNVSDTAQQVVLRRLWLQLAPECCVCRKRVDSMMEPRNDHATADIIVTFMCHGKAESTRLPGILMRTHEPMRETIRAWPKRVFLKNWARYSLIKPKREGRLE